MSVTASRVISSLVPGSKPLRRHRLAKEHGLGKFSQTLDHLGERPDFKPIFTQEGFPLHDLRGVMPCAASQLAGGSAF